MAKRPRPDHDATMDVSMSQLVPDAPARPRMPEAAPRGRSSRPPMSPMSPNDMSVWKQVVVGSDDFAPPPKARGGGRGRRWALAGLLGLVVAGGGAFAWYQLSRPEAPAAAPVASGAGGETRPAASAQPPAKAVAETPAKLPEEVAAKAAEDARPDPAELAAPAAGSTWFEGLATTLAEGTAPATWLGELAVSFASVLAAAEPAKKPAARGKRTGGTQKKIPTPKKRR